MSYLLKGFYDDNRNSLGWANNEGRAGRYFISQVMKV